MKYVSKDLGSFGLHLINSDKFKTITIRVLFHTPIKKEEITKRGVLADILLQSSKKYNSKRNLTIEAEELYAADISTNNQRMGNYIVTSFTLQVLRDCYTEENNLEKSIEFLSDIIFQPDVENNAFKKERLDIVKYNTVVSISSLKEDATAYSLTRMAEAYDKESPISYRMTGYIEDLEKITESNLYETYQKMIESDYVDIYVVGNFDNKEMTSLIKKYFKLKKIKKRKPSYYLTTKKPRTRRLFAKETIDNTQSKLAIICPLNKLTDYEKNYALLLGNIILGGGPDSKLFKEVREKNSLCYFIHSIYNKIDNVIVISAGIDKKNFQKTVDLISKNILDMKKGRFTDHDMDVAKEIYHTAREEIEESENRLIAEFIGESILGQEPMDERLKKIMKVNKRDIVRACKKISMDTVFLLEGVKDEND